MKFLRFIYLWSIAVLLTLHGVAFGQQGYYVSSIHGNDGNSGTSAALPWKSLSKLKEVLPSLSAGDVIYLERGSIWHETELTLSERNGTPSNPIVFTAYGEGPRPILSGSKVIESFTQSGNIFSASVYKDFADAPMNVPTGILLNGKWQDIARSQESLVYGSWSASEITDPAANWAPDRYAGSLILIQPVHWHWTPSPITSNSANTLYFQEVQHRAAGDKLAAFYIANHEDFLQNNGNWTFKDRTLKVYYNGDLNRENVQFAVSDTLLSVLHCNNVEFRDIVFEMANFRHISIIKGSNVNISGCEFRFSAGGAVKYYDTGDLSFTDNYVHDCGAMGLRLTYFGYAEVRRNLFRRISTQQIGMANYDFRMGAAITLNYCKEPMYHLEYNYFDSVGLAIQSHTFRTDGSASISYNYIENYGISISDCGAIYFNSDYGSEVKRVVKNNIIRNAISAGNRYPDNYAPVLHPHAIYIDDGALAYRCDSNTIENSCYAFYLNRNYKNTLRYSNIVNANQDNPDDYNAIFKKDQAIGTISQSADRDSIMFNNIVLFGEDPRVYLKHTGDAAIEAGVDENIFYYDYNKIASPFYPGEIKIARYMYNWGEAVYSYTLSEMQTDGGLISSIPTDMHTTLNPQSIMYSDVSSSVSEKDFVHLYTNYSSRSRMVNLGNVSFRDIDGQTITGSIVIPPFYSRILFYQSGNLNTTDPELYIDSTLVPSLVRDENGYVNNAPVLEDAAFVVQETGSLPAVIGSLSVYDADDTQGHTFSILSDNSGGLFAINNAGNLSFTTSDVDFTGSPVYQLVVQVRDNGSPSLTDNAAVSISLIEQYMNSAPIMEDQSFDYYGSSDASPVVGSVIAFDTDGDDLQFVIVNDGSGYFSIDGSTGVLSIDESGIDLADPATYTITVRVTDNGSPPLDDTAEIRVHYIPDSHTIFIDPDAPAGGDGTFSAPFNSLEGIEFEPTYSYLIKRGSESDLDRVVIDAGDIILGAYGEGELPVLNATTSSHVIQVSDQSNVNIQNLFIKADNALSGIYCVGQDADNLLISNCIIDGPDYGLRCINTGKTIIRYCQFLNNQYSVYTIASGSNFFYNVFSNAHTALHIDIHANTVKVFNNVFYNNREAIYFSGSQLYLNNNILFLSNESDKALEISSGSLLSDHNIYYPERQDFVTIDNTNYHRLADLVSYEQIDINSLVSDPDFVDPGSGNFMLSASSPAIDAGIYVGLQYDINGVPIPMGNAPDIGIVEFTNNQLNTDNPTHDPEAEHLLAFPNPVMDQLVIRSVKGFHGDESLFLYNQYGSLIQVITASELRRNGNHCLLDVSALDPGIYFIRISGEKRMGSLKFIKGN